MSWLRTAAAGVVARGDGWEVIPAHGASTLADIVVLATGNEAPAPFGSDLEPQAQRLILNNPWEAERKKEIAPDAAVLIAGTGLTAVDVVAELLHRRHVGPIFAFSRRALLPRCHGAAAAFPPGLQREFPSSLRGHRQKDSRVDAATMTSGDRWRGVMTELRSMAPALWAGWNASEKRRFLRHVRPFWDVHRHRLAPVVHAALHPRDRARAADDPARPARSARACRGALFAARHPAPKRAAAASSKGRSSSIARDRRPIRGVRAIRCCRGPSPTASRARMRSRSALRPMSAPG
jgi:uncharacterized NAD(P)/FAD-binding protein YdhS